MITIHPERRNITPQMAVRILKRHGRKVSLKQARIMLDLMYNLAIVSLNQLVNDENIKALYADPRQRALKEQYQKKESAEK